MPIQSPHYSSSGVRTALLSLLVLVFVGMNIFGGGTTRRDTNRRMLDAALRRRRQLDNDDHQTANNYFMQPTDRMIESSGTKMLDPRTNGKDYSSSRLFLPFRGPPSPPSEPHTQHLLLDDFGNGVAIPCYAPKHDLEQIFFLHMRKAAGSTIRSLISSHLGNFLNIMPSSSNNNNKIVEYGEPFVEMGDNVWRDQLLRNDTKTLYMTHLRDPIERIVSHYINEGGIGGPKVSRDWQKGKISLDELEYMAFPAWVALGRAYAGETRQGAGEFLRDRGKLSRYTPNYYLQRLTGSQEGCNQVSLDRALAILSQFDLVFVTEHLSDMHKYVLQRLVPRRPHAYLSREPFETKMDWYGKSESRQLQERNAMRRQVKMQHAELLQLLEEENACDRILYNAAKRMWTRQQICPTQEEEEKNVLDEGTYEATVKGDTAVDNANKENEAQSGSRPSQETESGQEVTLNGRSHHRNDAQKKQQQGKRRTMAKKRKQEVLHPQTSP